MGVCRCVARPILVLWRATPRYGLMTGIALIALAIKIASG